MIVLRILFNIKPNRFSSQKKENFQSDLIMPNLKRNEKMFLQVQNVTACRSSRAIKPKSTLENLPRPRRQLSGTLASLSTMGTQLRTNLMPLVHHCIMVPRGLRGALNLAPFMTRDMRVSWAAGVSFSSPGLSATMHSN